VLLPLNLRDGTRSLDSSGITPLYLLKIAYEKLAYEKSILLMRKLSSRA